LVPFELSRRGAYYAGKQSPIAPLVLSVGPFLGVKKRKNDQISSCEHARASKIRFFETCIFRYFGGPKSILGSRKIFGSKNILVKNFVIFSLILVII